MKTVYKAYDGKIFDTERECVEYERKGCKYYESRVVSKTLSEFSKGAIFVLTGEIREKETVIEGHCTGTRHCERCNCGGNIKHCDFHEEWREEGKRDNG